MSGATVTAPPRSLPASFDRLEPATAGFSGQSRGNRCSLHYARVHVLSGWISCMTSRAPRCVAKTHWGAPGAAWADKIVADPSHFYVIIGTKKYPQGAIGGVLHRP